MNELYRKELLKKPLDSPTEENFKKLDVALGRLTTTKFTPGCHYIIIHPKQYDDFKKIDARANYYFEHHKRRWEKRYKRPYPTPQGEIFNFSNFLITKEIIE